MIEITRPDCLLSSLPLSELARQDLKCRMAEPSRHYHNLHHLDVLWSRHLRHRDKFTDNPSQALEPLIALAIAYHDAVFVSGSPENEARSADLWLEVSATATTLALDERLWVADTIRATADHLGSAAMLDLDDAGDFARQWMLDLDLSPLGDAPETFDRNMALLSAEGAHKAECDRQAGVLGALRHFASARRLYRTQPLAAAFTEPARRNFERHLSAERRNLRRTA